jgi:hypothetical protein
MVRNGNRPRDEEVDDLLRRTLEPDPRTVTHIVAQALRDGPNGSAARSRLQAWRPARTLVAPALVLVVGIAIGATVWLRGPAPAQAARGTISNQGDIIVLIAPGRPITLVGLGPAARSAPRGTASVVLLGEPQ